MSHNYMSHNYMSHEYVRHNYIRPVLVLAGHGTSVETCAEAKGRRRSFCEWARAMTRMFGMPATMCIDETGDTSCSNSDNLPRPEHLCAYNRAWAGSWSY
jgi:hypothetical protein